MSWPQRRTRGRRSSYGRVLGVEDGGYMEAPGTIVGEIRMSAQRRSSSGSVAARLHRQQVEDDDGGIGDGCWVFG